MRIRGRTRRLTARSLRDFVADLTPTRRRIKRRLKTYAGPREHRGARRTFRRRRARR